MSAAGVFIRITNFILRLIQFCAAALILGIYSYFLAVLVDHGMVIPQWAKAVEGLSGAAALYTLLASLFTLCIGGIAFFAALMLFLDVCFIASFTAIAIMTRDGVDSCTGIVHTLLGSGDSKSLAGPGTGNNDKLTHFPDLGFACRLQKGAFSVAIIGCLLFALGLYPQILYARHHKLGKWFGPSPGNNYTEGLSRNSKRSFWRSRRRSSAPHSADPVTVPAADAAAEAGDDKYEKPPSRGPPASGVTRAIGSNTGGVGTVGGGGVSAGFTKYRYGQSGVADGGYSHGYGAQPQQGYRTAQFPESPRNF
ncbi:uncharacterized protein PADG_03470 [Paracoccidioides brasiliensis Pb18]|uniref:MARVEL domain-containing protein n=1 Tax=Paracoccidioides brasiliensis (strain Pb18) TaxID=502780 RepID=C1G5A0_PARBD|nr:uncharacterized protein PADG_03470 [Paracoccidioides brasiliensis Pb18]EEH47372.1 hypothetical protein PADG_03470 [Paracoccidioides brasiliensis Pb18]